MHLAKFFFYKWPNTQLKFFGYTVVGNCGQTFLQKMFVKETSKAELICIDLETLKRLERPNKIIKTNGVQCDQVGLF